MAFMASGRIIAGFCIRACMAGLLDRVARRPRTAPGHIGVASFVIAMTDGDEHM